EQVEIKRVSDEALNPKAVRKEVPSFKEFSQEFVDTYVKANNKPSEQRSKRGVFDLWLLPRFKDRRLDEIRVRDVERPKAEMLEQKKSPSRINNVLTCLGRMLRYAAEIELIESVPRIKLLRIPPQKF